MFFLGAEKGTLFEGENFTLQLRFNNEYVHLVLYKPIESPEVIFIGHIPIHLTYFLQMVHLPLHSL